MLMHWNRETRLSRIQALISVDEDVYNEEKVGSDPEGLDLRSRPASISVKANAESELIFVPGISHVMEQFSEQVEAIGGSKVKLEGEAGMHY